MSHSPISSNDNAILNNNLLREFYTLLSHLTVVDNQLRSQAEQGYQTLLKDQGDYAIQGLLAVLSCIQIEGHIRQLAAVLLRRSLIDDEESIYFRLMANSRHMLLQELLRLLREETNTTIRLRVCDIAGELGGTILEPKDWPDLAPTAYHLCKSPQSSDREVGLSLIGLLADSQIANNESILTAIHEILNINFNDYGSGQFNDNGKGVMLTLKTLNYTIQSLRAPSQLDVLKPLVTIIFQSFGVLIQQFMTKQQQQQNAANNTNNANTSINHSIRNQNDQNNEHSASQLDRTLCLFAEHLVDIADHSPNFFSNHVESFLSPILDCIEVDGTNNQTNPANANSNNIINQQQVSNHLKFLLIEFLVTLSNGITKRLKKVKGPNGEKDYFAMRFFPICLRMMSILPNEPNWETADTVEETHYDSAPCDVGESALRRATAALGVRNTYTIISSLLGSYLADTGNWQRQYAGLQCIAGYLEVSNNIQNQEQLTLHRKEVMGTLLHFMQHQHPRVKHAALYATSQFLLFHGNGLETEQSLQLMNAINHNIPIATNPSPRVRRNAVIALIQWIDVTPTSFLLNEQTQYSTKVLEIICQALREGPTIVQESCVSAIISIAETSKGVADTWLLHYPNIMPILKELLAYSHRRGLESLWSQALECVTVVGESAGKFLFYQDALELMELLTHVQNQLEPHSSLEAVLIKAWVRIARCLGSEFLPYLQVTMDKLFLAMSQDVTVPTTYQGNSREDDLDDDDDIAFDDEDDDQSDVEMIETNDGWVTVRTTLVEEQASAVQMILLLAEKLQEHFYPYVEQTVRLISNLVSSPHEDIRSFAIAALPELVRATGKAMPSNRAPLVELSGYTLGLLVKSVEVEGALDLIMTGLQAIRQIVLYASADWATLIAKTTAKQANSENTASTSGSTSSGPAGGAASPKPHGACKEGVLSLNLPSNDADSPSNAANLGVVAGFVRVLDESQMLILVQCVKSILRDSLQRRAVLHAEAQVNNAGAPQDEDDLDQEQQFFQESLELHFNISEVLNALFQTHGSAFYPIYMREWHDMISNLSHPFCLAEDRRFSFLVISDVIQYGVSTHTVLDSPENKEGVTTTAEDYLSQVLPVLIECCNTSNDYELKRTAAYAIGIAFELHACVLTKFLGDALQALKTAITAPLADPEEVDEYGLCIDNAVAAVGIITEQTLILQIEFHQAFLFQQWLQCLPLKNDLDEGEKVTKQLLRLITERKPYFNANIGLLASAVNVLVQIIEKSLVPKVLLQECASMLYNLTMNDEMSSQIMNFLTSDQHNRIQLTLAKAQEDGLFNAFGSISTSPLATAPIYDVLMQRHFRQ